LSRETQALPVPLTEDEIRHRGQELARRIQSRAEEAERQAEEKRRMRAQLEEMDAGIARLSEVVRTGVEHRSVEVVEQLVGTRVERIRTDTGEILSTRAATDEERQIGLFRSGEPDSQEATQ